MILVMFDSYIASIAADHARLKAKIGFDRQRAALLAGIYGASHGVNEGQRIGDCKGCGHRYTTIAAIYTCEYCGRKA